MDKLFILGVFVIWILGSISPGAVEQVGHSMYICHLGSRIYTSKNDSLSPPHSLSSTVGLGVGMTLHLIFVVFFYFKEIKLKENLNGQVGIVLLEYW